MSQFKNTQSNVKDFHAFRNCENKSDHECSLTLEFDTIFGFWNFKAFPSNSHLELMTAFHPLLRNRAKYFLILTVVMC